MSRAKSSPQVLAAVALPADPPVAPDPIVPNDVIVGPGVTLPAMGMLPSQAPLPTVMPPQLAVAPTPSFPGTCLLMSPACASPLDASIMLA